MQHGSSDRSVDSCALDMQPAIAEQSVDGFDAVLFDRISAAMTAKLGQRKLRTGESRADDAHQRGTTCLVLDEPALFEPM